jgi:hypothetical protein
MVCKSRFKQIQRLVHGFSIGHRGPIADAVCTDGDFSYAMACSHHWDGDLYQVRLITYDIIVMQLGIGH